MAGEGALIGLTQVLNTDLVRNGYSALNRLGDEIAAKLPKVGSFTANTDNNGYLIVTHGCGYTPSRVFCQSTATGGVTTTQVLGVDSIGPLTFRTRFAGVAAVTSATIVFQAYR